MGLKVRMTADDCGTAVSGVNGGISVVDGESGELVEFVQSPEDILPTNICFGGDDLKTAYLTLSGSGRLVSVVWPRPGLALAHSA